MGYRITFSETIDLKLAFNNSPSVYVPAFAVGGILCGNSFRVLLIKFLLL